MRDEPVRPRRLAQRDAVRTLTVAADTTAMLHNGQLRPLPAGTYEITDFQGTAARGIIHIAHPRDGLRVSVFPHDPHITVS